MKKWKLLIAAVLLAVCAASVAFAAGYVKDFSVEYDEPLCIVQTDYITMEVNSIGVEDGYLEIDTLVTNSNAKRGYEVTIARASINGIEIYPTYSEDVDAEDENGEAIEIDLSNVIENTDITDITDIELTVVIEDDDMEVVYRDVVNIYPYGEEKAERYVRPTADTDVVVLDNDKFTVTVTDCEYVEDWGYSVHMFIQNKTDATVYVEGAAFSLNDVDAATRYDDYVGPKGASISHLEWSQSDLDEAGVEDVTSISFILNIYDEKADKLLCGQTVVLNP